ncbi:TBC1 domain family member 20 isoform X2 [Amyelois transitella]|uniref:TBC1 domain family member 20 isoform X2 n=1 Tax=Amyelois transitella TaxID=680683 RepID=UPI00298FCB28|nr:TBC1 domain family member 20 isoform X2 [Amyelois transitella]
MEPNNTDADIGDTCNLNGDCSSPAKKQVFDPNHTKNIDDISSPSELKFDLEKEIEDPEITAKRKEIEACIADPDSVDYQQWKSFAVSTGGLICDEYRKVIWPLLVGVTKEEMTDPPSLDELSTHQEYSQVVLDVNRSLKRFPPGIPYEQRVALQDQLTVLILRVIIEYPHLKYYQGYHDVAITLLLVCGDRASFPLLCRLSCGAGAPLAPFMQLTMQPTQHLLNYMLPVIARAEKKLADCLEKAGVGTMFALPWYLTWFGHSLNRYSDVVRLYDYFLCAPPLFPVYVTAAIVLHRAEEVYVCDCDMAMMHCLLSRLPDDLPFEDILVTAKKLYDKNDPSELEMEVYELERREEEQRRQEEEERLRRRQLAARNARAAAPPPCCSACTCTTAPTCSPVETWCLGECRPNTRVCGGQTDAGKEALRRCIKERFRVDTSIVLNVLDLSSQYAPNMFVKINFLKWH